MQPRTRGWSSLAGLACAALAGACADGGPAPLDHDLLWRSPDERLEQPGELVPALDEPWGALDRGGFGRTGGRRPDGATFVWTTERVARLALPCGAPRARTVELELWAPRPSDERGAAATRVEVRLNGEPLGAAELGPAPVEVALEAAAELWREGENELALEVDALTAEPSGRRLGCAVARVRYGERRRVAVDLGGARLTLDSGTGVRYGLEGCRGGLLELLLEAAAPGRLRARFGWSDPATGERGFPEAGRWGRAVPAGPSTERVALPESGDEVVWLELGWEADSGAPGDALAVSGLRVLAERPPRPPIVFVSVDTLAANHLSVYGYERPTTPFLERFAREALVFERCTANAPWTVPSYLSQLSGLYPRAQERVAGEEATRMHALEALELPANRWTLAESLRGAGYATAAFAGNPWLGQPLGLRQGFDRFDAEARDDPASEHGRPLAALVPPFLDWLDGLPDGAVPFALLNPMDTHGPYTPAPPHRGRFAADGRGPTAPVAPELGLYGRIPGYIARSLVPEGELPPELPVDALVAAYDEEILALDAELERLWSELCARGLDRTAVVVVSADHGESMVEHGWLFGHGTIHTEVARVPLLVRLPGGRHGGRRVREPVQLVDLFPTFLELAGIRARREHLHGRSLAGLLAGAAEPDRSALCESAKLDGASIEVAGWRLIETHPGRARVETLLSHPRARAWMARERPELLERLDADASALKPRDVIPLVIELREALEGPFHELYDTRADPAELADLAEREPDRVRALVERLEDERRRGERARASARFDAASRQLSAEAAEDLRGLGYLGDE